MYLVSTTDLNGVNVARSDDVAPVVKVYAQSPDNQIRYPFDATHGGEMCQIIVQDNGIGFDEKYLDRRRYPARQPDRGRKQTMKKESVSFKLAHYLSHPTQSENQFLINIVVLGLTAMALLFGFIIALLWTLGMAPVTEAIAGFSVIPFYLLAYWLSQRGRQKLAARIPVVILFLTMTGASYQLGLGHATMVGFAVVTLAAGVLISVSSALLFALLSVGAHIAIGLAQSTGRLPNPLAPEATVISDGIALGLALAVLVIFYWLSDHQMKGQLTVRVQAEQELKQTQEEIERQNARLAALYRAGQVVNSTLDTDAILDQLTDEAMRVTCATHGQVLVVREKTGRFDHRSLRGFSPQQIERIQTIPLALSQGVTGRAYITRQAICVDDVRVEPDYFPLIPDTRAELTVPIIREGQVLGNLDLQSPEVGAFRGVDLDYLNALADQVAVALDNARLFEQIQQRTAHLEWLALIESTLSQATDEEQILIAITMAVDMDQLPNRIALHYLDTDENDQPTVLYAVSVWHDGIVVPDDPTRHQRYEIQDLPISKLWLAAPNETLFISDVQTDPRTDDAMRRQATQLDFNAIVLMPLRSGGRWQGLVTFFWSQPHTFSPDEHFYLQKLLESASAVVARRRAYLAQQQARNESERRALELHTAAQVSRAASSILDVNELLSTSVKLIHDHFDLYHVGLYLIDEVGKEAVLRAGTGQAGQAMLEQGHKLALNSASTIGWCIDNKQAHIALDVDQTVPPANPFLQHTRSEIALPLISRGEAIGALTVQSTAQHAFSNQDLAVFQTMADQIANATANARLYQQAQQEIAERKRVEAALKTYAARLEQTNRELRDFLYVASHDLQEPLRKIQTLGDRMQIRYAGGLDQRGNNYLERMQKAAARMQSLINALLTYSRVMTKTRPFVSVDLDQLIRKVVSDLRTDIERLGGRVEVRDMPSIDADPVQMHHLFHNLIENALKFHRPSEPPLVQVYAQQLNDQTGHATRDTPDNKLCQIVVQDNGIGFDEKHLDRIFQVFQRLHGRDEYKGTGIGLAICHKIVERHGGDITAQSAPCQGATFFVTLPIKQRQRN